jgi:RNA polymerase sigma factor (sigma-70 family)
MSELAARAGGSPLSGVGRLSSDERLTRQAAKGDTRAFAAIFRRYHQDLYRYCMAILGDSQDAQDALQNTMVKVMRALPDEQRQIHLKPWLYRIAHNESIDLIRSRRPLQPLDPELAAPGFEPAQRAEQRARLQHLLVDLEDLPERQRGALLMRELAGLSFAEIGTALDASPAVVRQTIYEARLNLRRMDAGRETSCDAVTRALSDADGRVARRRDIRAHLRQCESCRAFRDQIRERGADLAAIAPLPAAAAAGILHGILGGGGPGGSGGIFGALGGGAGKAVGGSAALKSAAAVVAVAVVGAGVADRSGLVHIGSSVGGMPSGSSSQTPAGEIRDSVLGPNPGRAMSASAAVGRKGGHSAKRSVSAIPGRTAAATPAQSAAPAALPGHPAATADQLHAQEGHPDLPAASTQGQETAAAHKGGAEAPAHPAPPPHPTSSEHPTKPEHPTKESHPGSGKAPPPSGLPAAAAETGESAAGGGPPKAPPAAAGPAEHGAGESGVGAHGPPAEHGPGAHGPPDA